MDAPLLTDALPLEAQAAELYIGEYAPIEVMRTSSARQASGCGVGR